MLGLVLAGLVAYANTVDGEWVWDDASSILLHKHVQDPGKLLQLFQEDQHAFGRGAGNFYRPLLSATFLADYALSHRSGLDEMHPGGYPDVSPFLFHVSNMAWHIAAALLLLALLTRLGAPRFVRAAATLVWLVHPLHTEAVAYISGRADMMSAAFMFAGLCCALWKGASARRIAGVSLSILCFTGALLSKESALIFPVLLALVLFFDWRVDGDREARQGAARHFAPLAPAMALVVVYGVLRTSILKFAEAGASQTAPLAQRLVEVGQAFAFYMRVLFVPAGLHMEQSLAGTPAWTALAGYACLACILALVALAWRTRRYRIVLGLAWFLAAWLPISGLFPLNAPMAEHWMYLPMAGFWWAVAELVWEAVNRPVPRLAATKRMLTRPMAVLLVFFAAVSFLGLTVQRNQDWHSNETLFRATLAQNPNTLRVHYNLAVAYDDLLENNAGARRHYEAVLGFYQQQKRATSVDGDTTYVLPEEIDVRLSLGKLCLAQEEYAEAAGHFGRVAAGVSSQEHTAEVAAAAMGLGRAMLALGKPNDAMQALQQAMTLNAGLQPEVEALLTGAPIIPRM